MNCWCGNFLAKGILVNYKIPNTSICGPQNPLQRELESVSSFCGDNSGDTNKLFIMLKEKIKDLGKFQSLGLKEYLMRNVLGCSTLTRLNVCFLSLLIYVVFVK